MLHIILLILKILGIILLALVGILLTVLLLFLFVPVRYRLFGEQEGRPRGDVFVSWLLRILTVKFTYEERAVLTVRIFGIPLLKRQVWPEEDEESFDEDSEPSTVRMAGLGGPEDEVLVEEPVPERPGETVLPPLKAAEPPEKQNVSEEEASPPETGGTVARFWEKVCGWFSDRLSRIKAAVKNVRRSFKHAKRKIQKARDFCDNEENRKTFRLLIRQTKRLFKHLLPRKVKGRICFGFDDPYYTGQVLSAVSPFYGLYAKSLSLEPVFGEKALEGNLEIRGYIRLGTLLLIVLRVFANRNFRILLKKWRS